MAAIGACAGFGAICGSSVATAATMGQVALPELRRYGYSGSLSTGALAAGGTLAAAEGLGLDDILWQRVLALPAESRALLTVVAAAGRPVRLKHAQRAAEIAFTAAYLEIPSTYIVPAGSPIRTVDEVDREGVRIEGLLALGVGELGPGE